MKVCSYCRVSTDKDDQKNSLDNQKSYFQEEVIKREHEYINTYFDEGLSGTKLYNRDGFIKLLNDAGLDLLSFKNKNKTIQTFEISDREPLFNEIWIKNTSRFARNTLSSDIIGKLREKKVYVYFIEQNINTKDISQDFILKLFQLFDEQDSRDKSTKVCWGHEQSKNRGLIHSHPKLYGYQYIKGDKREENTLRIIPEEAEIIKEIFELYSKGFGIRRIRDYLTSKNKRTRNNKSFGNSTIKRIIDNEKYAGYNNRGKFDTGIVFSKNKYPKVKDHYEYVYSDKIPAIVDEETFFKCREILQSKVNHTSNKGKYTGITDYAGLIFCGRCGSVYHSNKDVNRWFYNCSNKKKNGTKVCDNINVKKKDIDKLFDNLINGEFKENVLGNVEDIIFDFRRMQLFLIDKLNIDNSAKVKELKERLEELNKSHTSCIDLYIDPKRQNKNHIKNQMDELESQINKLNHEIQELSKGNKEILADIKGINREIEKLENLEINENYSHNEMIQQVTRITIDKHFNNPNEILFRSDYKIMEYILKIYDKYDTRDIPIYDDEEFNERMDKLEQIIRVL